MTAKTPSQKLKIGVGYIRESTEEQDKGFSPEKAVFCIFGGHILPVYKTLVVGM